MSIGCLSRHLCGAVHAGALLLLESAERLEPAVLSAFSQRLMDLQRMCLSLHQGRGAAAGLSSATASPASQDLESGSESSEEGEGPPVIPLLELGTDEAKPYQPRVLGNILFGGRLLRVRETYGCVVTLERLPEPLCLALRPLAVLPPDLTRLAEVTLLAAGFREAARLAEKLCVFLCLEGELSPGPHRSRPTLVREVIRMAVHILFSPPARQESLAARAKPSARTAFLLGLEEEPAMVKALSSSHLLSGPDCPRLHSVHQVLREVFPSACSQPYEPQVPPRLQGALVTQLHEDKLQMDPELLHLAGQLSQALLGAPSILLLGPSGSGKTTVWRTLAKAQSRLAASNAVPGAPGPGAPQPTSLRPVSTVCLWPNGLTVAEFVGSLEGTLWQDGVLSRLLQRAATSALAAGSGQGSSQQWLVLDGATSAEWLEPMSSLFSPRPCLSLPNGQRLQAPESVRFLFEMPDASGVPPSACAHCTLLYCGGPRLWQVLLSAALAPVYRKYSVTQESLALLHELAEELFPPTLAFLQQQHGCSVLLPHSHPQSPLAQGVQETAAFTRIFHALLEQYLRRDRIKRAPAAPEPADAKATVFASHSSAPHSLDDAVPAHHHLLAQSIFVFAYIWGFGSHLHPRHWPPFDRFVHRALRNSRLSIQLPSAASAFDLCPLAENGTLEPFDGRYLSSRVKGIPVSFSVLPQYERVLFVTDLLLGSDQPLLLVGEPGCGKSSFAEMLVQPNHFYHRVCLTPALGAVHLRRLLQKKSLSTIRDKGFFPMGKAARGTVSKGRRCLFLVEDLHLAFVDPVRGSSPVIESLRQALSLHQFYHAETLELQHCPAAGFNCFGTLSVPLTGAPPLCPRFGRLFSVVVLPAVTRESLLSMHVGSVLAWLEKFPLLTRHCDLASALVRATADTYEAARSRFQPSPACCLFCFSLHDIHKALLQENPSIKRTMRDDLILQRFSQFVRSNLHVLLLLGGPRSLALPPLLATALAQVLCSREIYQPWSYKCLLEVTFRHLKHHCKHSARLTREPTSLHVNKDLVHRIAKAAALIHSSVMNYATFLAANLPLVSPKSLLDFLDTFVVLLNGLQERNNKQTDRMKLALHNMGEVSKKQQEHTRDVHFLQQKLVRIKEQVAYSQREVEREQEVLKQQEAECQQYEARIDALTKERDSLEKGKELAMKKVSKDYQAALAALRVQDIEELRSYRQPPSLVVQVTDMLCMMFHQEPGWETAKLLLSREDFYQELIFFPKDNLPTELFGALGRAVHNKAFSAASLRSASQAALALYQWILAVYWYHWALRDWQPAILQMQQCEEQITSEKVNLGDRRLHSEYLRNATQTRIRELTLKQERQEKLLHQLTQSLQAKEEATTVESSVAEHMVNWTSLVKGLECQHSTVHGDALLCAAILSYLGPFTPARREELLEKWQALCAGSRVSLGPDDVSRLLLKDLPCPGSASFGPPLLAVQKPFVLSSLLSSTQEQRLWDRVHKPKDPESRLVAMILHSKTHTRAHRWPLLVDPDRQALTWLLMTSALQEEESQACVLSDLVPDMVEQGGFDEMPEDKFEILSLTAPDLDQSLRIAASQGSPVLLTDFEKKVPWCLALQQLMQKESFRGTEDTVLLPSRSEKEEEEEEEGEGEEEKEKVLVPPSFQLYLCTELPLEALAAEASHVPLKSLNVIDLSLSQGALEELLLVEVVHAERREVLTNQQALHLGVLQLEGKLEATEEELVALISQPQRSLLEEENFLPMMRLLQTQIQALRATHQHMASQDQGQAALCDKYRQVARLGVGLHQALQQVCRLHPLYRFPAALCIHRVRQALVSAKRQESSKQESLETRLLELKKAVLRQLLTQALPCLREADRLLYVFLGALATLRAAGDISPLEWLAFCQGLREPAATALLQPEASVPRPGWVCEEAWRECALLEGLPGFRGLPASLASRAAQWQEYFHLPSTVVGPALCPSHAHLSPFQRAILWRILSPGAMSSVMADLTTCLLGWSLKEEMTATSPYAYSRPNKPVIFLTPAAESPGSFMHPLLWIQQMAAQRGRAGRVVVISFGTPDAARRVWRALPFCTKKGKWLVLNNCHLQESWDQDVLTLLELVLSTQAGENEGGALEIHPKFRLWLITAADAPDSVPGLLHRNATTLFCEMPLELKSILACTHRWLQGQVQNLDAEQRLPLLVLYGVMLYRQAYAQWTQAAAYMWSHGEVLAGLRTQEQLSRLKDSPNEALQELAGTILYGGHVLDEGDAQAVQSLCQQCLSPASQLQPSTGLQSLLALVVGCRSPGLSEEEAEAATQARIEHLPSPMEPAWVGLCSGLQREMLACRSRVLLSALQASQGLWQPRVPPGSPPGSQQQEALEQLLQEGLVVVQELLEQLEQCGRQVGARGHLPQGQPRPKPRPLERFLLEEGGSFVALLRQVARDLRCTQERLQGACCSSRRCLATLQDLQRGRLPRPWLAYAPTGPQSPQAWLETLQQRSQLLCCYLGSVGGPPVVHYQLAAFHHPHRLFLALLREMARVEKQELDHYQLEQQVLPSVLPPSSAPDQGIYLYGLEVHNATWNPRGGHLQETLSAQPCRLPTVWIQASRQPWKPASVLPVYRCPVYLGAPNEQVSLSSSRVLLHLALPSKMSPDLCAQRRVHIVSLLQ